MANGIGNYHDDDPHITKTRRKSRVKPLIQALNLPILQPKSPAVDFRVGTIVQLTDGSYTRDVESVLKNIKVYAPDADPTSATPITTISVDTTPGSELEYTIPVGYGLYQLVGDVTPTDDLGRHRKTFYTNQQVVILDSTDPQNTVAPSQSGTGYLNELMTLDTGTWTGIPVPTIDSILQKNGADVPGTENTFNYTPVASDLGSIIGWRVWARGFETETSITVASPITIIAHALRTSSPTIIFSGVIGATATRTLGTIVGTPTPTITGSWALDGVDISPAQTGATYVPGAPDAGKQLSWHDWAVGYQSTTDAYSNTIPVQSASTDPFNITPPSQSGSSEETSVQTVDRGTWNLGTPPGTVTSIWQREDSVGAGTFSDIGGASGTTYTLLHTDIGKRIRCSVWVSGFKPQTVLYTTGVIVEASPGVTFPAYLTRIQWKAVQVTAGNGAREAKFGTDAGAAVGVTIPADFSLYVKGSLSEISTNLTTDKLVNPSGNDTVSLPNDEPDNTLVYHAPIWEHIASGERRLAHDPTDTVVVDDVTGPYGLLQIQPAVVGDTVSTLDELLDAIQAAGTGAATILLAPGAVFNEFIWPYNRRVLDANDNDVTPINLILRSIDPNNPAIFRGIAICPGSGREGQYINLATPRGVATNVSGVWFDKVSFYAERYDTYKQKNSSNTITLSQGGTGYNLSVAGVILPDGHPRKANNTNYHESWTGAPNTYNPSSFTTFGYHHGQNANKIRITNSTFNGFGFQINLEGRNLTVAQNRFTAHPVDVVRFSGTCANATLEWNVIDGHRTLTATESGNIGFTDGSKPPHGDTFQTLGDTQAPWIRYNYMEDTTDRLHFGILNSGSGGGNQDDILVENNESRQSHKTGWTISAVDGVEFNFNKSTRISGGATIEFNIGGNGNDTTNTNCTNNIAGRFLGNGNHIVGGQDGNVVENLSDTLYKTGFTQIRQNKVANGARYAGINGNVNNVAWTDRS